MAQADDYWGHAHHHSCHDGNNIVLAAEAGDATVLRAVLDACGCSRAASGQPGGNEVLRAVLDACGCSDAASAQPVGNGGESLHSVVSNAAPPDAPDEPQGFGGASGAGFTATDQHGETSGRKKLFVARDDYGFTALMRCVYARRGGPGSAGWLGCLAMLLYEAGTDEKAREWINARDGVDGLGSSALVWAAAPHVTHEPDSDAQQFAAVAALLACGAEPAAGDNFNKILLAEHAASAGSGNTLSPIAALLSRAEEIGGSAAVVEALQAADAAAADGRSGDVRVTAASTN